MKPKQIECSWWCRYAVLSPSSVGKTLLSQSGWERHSKWPLSTNAWPTMPAIQRNSSKVETHISQGSNWVALFTNLFAFVEWRLLILGIGGRSISSPFCRTLNISQKHTNPMLSFDHQAISSDPIYTDTWWNQSIVEKYLHDDVVSTNLSNSLSKSDLHQQRNFC